ncbi:MAG TPA: tRNA (5-methylaminomethyl-2-thiouridine)(34)-methyltransferase MnmD [Chitinophagaceae bacterium]|jgi:tRNA U34 5-methylaminomethyl-2-thiouridine-forming methyltransferase MnmC|nr:tRNA (5-methylaminomethyl-2-thiouridine)(34)-methyltransferase MnmD [Chitinophagaceae bacterium]
MQRKLILTGDGSHSVSLPEMNVTYHSIHGAIQESIHVFNEAGFYKVSDALQASDTIHILEMGFGTGLNALLTLIEAKKSNQKIYYEALEPFPLSIEEIRSLNYCEILQRNDLQPSFERLHSGEWEEEIKISETFYLHKTQQSLQNYKTCLAGRQASELKNLIFFDAFAPNAQPELWTEEIFQKMFSILQPGGILVTYCSKGSVRRAMQAAGFVVEKIPGPPGKREMIRARKAK